MTSITSDRLNEILNCAAYGELKFNFIPPYASSSYITHPKGITREENKAIRSLWNTLPGSSSYYDAVRLLGRAKRSEYYRNTNLVNC